MWLFVEMIKPDVITIYPFAYDYPVWRELITKNRHFFNQVIISFTYNDVSRDYREFLKENHKDFTFIDNGGSSEWYDGAINSALEAVKSDYVLFLEQDFYFTPKFLNKTFKIIEETDFICWEQNTRFHLAYFLTTMRAIDQTSRYFQDVPRYRLDCFDLFCAEMLVRSGDFTTFTGYKNCGHLNGLTHNLRLGIEGNIENIYEPDKFKNYLEKSLIADVKQLPEWVEITKNILKLL